MIPHLYDHTFVIRADIIYIV